MLQRLGQMAESLPDLETADRLAPGNARILDLMGWLTLLREACRSGEGFASGSG